MLIQISPFRLVYRYFCPAQCSLSLYEIADTNLTGKFKRFIWLSLIESLQQNISWNCMFENLKLLLHKDFGPIVPNHWPDVLDKLGSYAKANFLTQSRINFPKSPINPWDGYFFRYKAWQLLLPATIPMSLLGFLQVFSVNNFQVLDDFDW